VISKVRDEIKPSELYTSMMQKKRRTFELEPRQQSEKVEFMKKHARQERDCLDSKYGKLGREYSGVKTKHQGNDVGSLLSYDFAPQFRDQNLAQKPGNMMASTLGDFKRNESVKYFGKRPSEITRHNYPNLREL
jgi:hypothetical protein